MAKFWAIVRNTFTQTIRQPIFALLILLTFAVLVLDLPLAGWTMGSSYHETDQKMLIELGLSTLLISGLLISAFSASGVLSREIEDKTALTVIAKPVSRWLFVLGKFVGVAGAVIVAYYLCSLAFLLTVRHRVMPAASDPYDWPVIVLGLTALGLTFAIATAGNFLFGWTFASAAVMSGVVCFTLTAATVGFLGKGWQVVSPGYDKPPKETARLVKVQLEPGWSVDGFVNAMKNRKYRIDKADADNGVVTMRIPADLTLESSLTKLNATAGVAEAGKVTDPPVIGGQLLLAMALLLMGVMIFVATAVAASTRLGQVMTLVVCLAVYVVGALHSALFGRWADSVWLARALGHVAPRLAYFVDRPIDAITLGLPLPGAFVALAGGYCAAYVAAVLLVGMALFQRRPLEAQGSAAALPGAVALLAFAGRVAALALAVAGLVAFSLPAFHTATGILKAAALLAAAIGLWLLWGYFSRGLRWSYYAAAALCAAVTAVLLVGLQAPGAEALRLGQGPVPVLVEAVVAALALLVIVLPKTRRHFASAT